jgi:hypothetical protein
MREGRGEWTSMTVLLRGKVIGWVEISSTFRFYNNGRLPRMLLTSVNGLIRWWEVGLLLSAEYNCILQSPTGFHGVLVQSLWSP